MDKPDKSASGHSSIPRISRLPMPPPKGPTLTATGLRPSPSRDTLLPTPKKPKDDQTGRPRIPSSTSRLSSGGRLARPLTQAFGNNGLPITLAPPSSDVSDSKTLADSHRGLRRSPSYQSIASRSSSPALVRGISSDRPKPPLQNPAPLATVDTDDGNNKKGVAGDDDDDDDDIIIRRTLVLTGRRTSTSHSTGISPERTRLPPRTADAMSAAWAGQNFDDISSTSPIDDAETDISPYSLHETETENEDLEALQSPTKLRSSLSDRTVETLATLASSPAKNRSTFFGGPVSDTRSRSRPGSRGSRPGSRDSSQCFHESLRSSSRPTSRQSLASRPSFGVEPNEHGAATSGLRTPSGTFRRPLSTINDTPHRVSPEKTRSLNTPSRGSLRKIPSKQFSSAKPGATLSSKIPSRHSIEAGSTSTSENRAGFATSGVKTVKPRSSASAPHNRTSINTFRKPPINVADNVHRQSVESTLSTVSSNATNVSRTSSVTSMSSAGRATPDPGSRGKSSAALRDHIARLRIAKRDSQATTEDSGIDADRDSQSQPQRLVTTGHTAVSSSTEDIDNLAPWSHRDPFNKSSAKRHVDDTKKKVLQDRIEVGRTTGRLNIAALDLGEIPSEVLKMYDLASIGAYDGTWAESVDLTRFVVADNELETIDDSVFPDRANEELMGDECSNGNMFAGLETLDLHGNLLISLPAGLRQLRQLTSLNLTHNRLSNDSIDIISQITSLRNLKLGSNLLYGPLGASFANLESLEVLDLHGNTISALPTGLAKMRRLRILNISENGFETLPFDKFSKLPLTELHARKNKLSGILIQDPIDSVPSLQSLDLTSNKLTHLVPPGRAARFPLLHQLSVSMNRLQELPDMIGMRSLLTLAADENAITALPDGFSGLEKLRHADFSNNDIRIIPAEVGCMRDLTMLRITGNPLRDKKFLTITTDEIKECLSSRLERQQPPQPEATALGNSLLDKHGRDDEVDGGSRAATVDVDMMATDRSAHHDCSSDSDDFATPPTSAPASPTRSQGQTTTTAWPVKPGGILDRSATESSTLHPVICARIAREHKIRQAMLHRNSFATLPECLTFFANTLTCLSLSHNKLESDTYLSEPLELHALQELNLSHNRIESLAPLLSYLIAPCLEKLDISGNRLKSLPGNMRQSFPRLDTLLAESNHIGDLEPRSIQGMRVVNVSRNEITHLNPRIGLLAAGGPGEGTLEKLEVQGNRFRVPRWSILDMGTAVTLRWLRGRIPLTEMSEIPGWRDERKDSDC